MGSLRSSAPDHHLGHLDGESLAAYMTDVPVSPRIFGAQPPHLAVLLLRPAAQDHDLGHLDTEPVAALPVHAAR